MLNYEFNGIDLRLLLSLWAYFGRECLLAIDKDIDNKLNCKVLVLRPKFTF